MILPLAAAACILWSAQSWTPRVEEIQQLRTAQRAMLPRIVAGGRGPDEDYINFIQRVTRRAETFAKSAGVRRDSVPLQVGLGRPRSQAPGQYLGLACHGLERLFMARYSYGDGSVTPDAPIHKEMDEVGG